MQLSLVETTLWLDLGKLRMRDIYALSDEEVLRFFVRQRLLKNKMNCDKRGRSMRINKREKLIDGKWASSSLLGPAVLKLLTNGDILNYMQVIDRNAEFLRSVQSQKFMHVLFFELHRSLRNSILDGLDSRRVNVFAEGENNNMSLGNPLGTSKRQQIFFNSSSQSPKIMSSTSRYSVHSISMGLHTSIFLGKYEDRSKSSSNTIFVSGKFGDKHFMLPQAIVFEDKVVCAATGHAHSLVCSKNTCYGVGDNSKNQLGFGPTIQHLASHRPLVLGKVVAEPDIQIKNCATSNNHSILLTSHGFFVCGTNVGQMGEYASRAFNQKLGPTKSFTRLLGPEDPFMNAGNKRRGAASSHFLPELSLPNTSKTIGMALADDTTAVYVGNKLRVFFEYHDYKCSINYEACIIGVAVCKPVSFAQTVVVLCMSNLDIFLWTKTSSSRLIEPIWRMPYVSEYEQLASFVDSNHRFACTQNGDFTLLDNGHIPYSGCLSMDEGTIQCRVDRMNNPPGYVNGVFMSPTGCNTAFLVFSNISNFQVQDAQNRMQKRQLLMGQIHQQSTKEQSSCIQILSKSRTFLAHPHLISLRAPGLLNHRDKQGRVDLKQYGDESVDELLEFIYLNSSASLEHIRTHGFILLKSVDLREVMEDKLQRLAQLAKDVGFEKMEFCMLRAMNSLEKKILGDDAPIPFLQSTADISSLFTDGDVNLVCRDGSLKFSKGLLQQIPYFEALCRWNDSENTNQVEDIHLEGVSTEIAELVRRFIIANDLHGVSLSFEQTIELLFFADRYMLMDLVNEVVDKFETKIHLDILEEVVELTKILAFDRLDEMLANFMVDHLPFVLHSKYAVLRSLPDRILCLVNQRLHQYLNNDESAALEESEEGRCLALCFAHLTDEHFKAMEISVDNDEMDPWQFLKTIKKRRVRRTSKKTSLCEALSNVHVDKSFLSESIDENRTVNGEQRTTPDLHTLNHTPAIPASKRSGASTPIAIVKEKSVLNWASNSLSNPQSPILGLDEIMKQESQCITPKKPVKFSSKTFRPVKVALSTTPTSPSSSSTHNWAKVSVQSPVSSQPQSLKDIQADEIAFVTASATPKPQKPISLVELEEQAILELESYYNTIHEEGTHFFVVYREKPNHENGDTKPTMSTHWRSSNGFI